MAREKFPAYEHVLFAVDLSEEAMEVGARAAGLAGAYGARLSLVHVLEPRRVGSAAGEEWVPSVPPGVGGVPPAAPIPPHEVWDAALRQADEFLDTLIERLAIAPDARRQVVSGPTRGEIHRVAKDIDADVIVVGSHGRHGLALLLGSTANAVLHDAPCDVLAVRVRS